MKTKKTQQQKEKEKKDLEAFATIFPFGKYGIQPKQQYC